MDLLSKDKILKVMAVTRFHFVSGMPTAGSEMLMDVLAQNPKFSAQTGSAAAPVFRELVAQCRNEKSALAALDLDTQHAMLRGALDAVHHARPLDSVVFDDNPAWMSLTYEISQLMPLSRFIFVVRDPAAIAAEMARDSGAARRPADLMADTGVIGAPLKYLQSILSGPNAERVILIDRERLMNDPVAVLDVLYRFLRIPAFEHDVSAFGGTVPRDVIEPRGLRRIVSLAAPMRRKSGGDYHLPVWRKLTRSDAVMVLSTR